MSMLYQPYGEPETPAQQPAPTGHPMKGSFSPRMPPAQPTSWPQPHERPWVRTTELRCFWVANQQTLWDSKCCFQLPSLGVICYTASLRHTRGISIIEKTLAYHSLLGPFSVLVWGRLPFCSPAGSLLLGCVHLMGTAQLLRPCNHTGHRQPHFLFHRGFLSSCPKSSFTETWHHQRDVVCLVPPLWPPQAGSPCAS